MMKVVLTMSLALGFSLRLYGQAGVEIGQNSTTQVTADLSTEVPTLPEENQLEPQRSELPKSAEPTSPAEKRTEEKNIPLYLDSKASSKSTLDGGGRVFMTAFLVLTLMGSAIYLAKRRSFLKSKPGANQIKILTQHFLGPKKSLAVVRVAGESILIGVTDHSISHIRTLTLVDEEIETDPPKNFQTALSSEANSEEEFSMQGIQTLVKRKVKSLGVIS